VVEKIREAGGEVIGITSEPQSLTNEAELDWELPFACVGDPHHEILSECPRPSLSSLARARNASFSGRSYAFSSSSELGLSRSCLRRPRSVVIGKIGARHWSAVITYRDTCIRIISVRRSRKEEVEIYEG